MNGKLKQFHGLGCCSRLVDLEDRYSLANSREPQKSMLEKALLEITGRLVDSKSVASKAGGD